MSKVNIFWFRRDLRLEDNAGLLEALKSGLPVVPLFIFDTDILHQLEGKRDRRVHFILLALQDLQSGLLKYNSTLDVRLGAPKEVFQEIVRDYAVRTVFTNHDYEPYAIERDRKIAAMLSLSGISFHSFKDQVVFEKNEVVKEQGTPYAVFTPYSKKWKSLLSREVVRLFNTSSFFQAFYRQPPRSVPSIESLGFVKTDIVFTRPTIDTALIQHYDQTRNQPSLKGTTGLGVHLRFGTISIRQVVRETMNLNESFLNELVWREFFMQILWHHPRVVQECFRKAYENISWRNREEEFERWCRGMTGYPLVDAGIRELNATGFMHNRVRMITASFLVKHLLVDWRWGEAYFAARLLDYELASNNGNWQWAAGCGCDAAPYFRIFNPYQQAKKFDPQSLYINRWIPELKTGNYPPPMVDHELARKRCLETYKKALADQRLME